MDDSKFTFRVNDEHVKEFISKMLLGLVLLLLYMSLRFVRDQRNRFRQMFLGFSKKHFGQVI